MARWALVMLNDIR